MKPLVSDGRILNIEAAAFAKDECLQMSFKDGARAVRSLYEADRSKAHELLRAALECVDDDIRACEHHGLKGAAEKFRELKRMTNEHLKDQ